jgi:hypothetical protein
MALLMMVCFNSGTMPFRYPAGIRAIAATKGDYLVLAGVFVGVQIGAGVVGVGADFVLRNVLHIPSLIAFMAGDYMQAWLTFYGLLVASYAVGRFYQLNAQRLAWFE